MFGVFGAWLFSCLVQRASTSSLWLFLYVQRTYGNFFLSSFIHSSHSSSHFTFHTVVLIHKQQRAINSEPRSFTLTLLSSEHKVCNEMHSIFSTADSMNCTEFCAESKWKKNEHMQPWTNYDRATMCDRWIYFSFDHFSRENIYSAQNGSWCRLFVIKIITGDCMKRVEYCRMFKLSSACAKLSASAHRS